MLRSKHVFFQEPDPLGWPATSNQEVPVFLAELLQSLKLYRIYGSARARLLALCLEESLLDPTHDFAVSHTKMCADLTQAEQVFAVVRVAAAMDQVVKRL